MSTCHWICDGCQREGEFEYPQDWSQEGALRTAQACHRYDVNSRPHSLDDAPACRDGGQLRITLKETSRHSIALSGEVTLKVIKAGETK